MSEIVTIDQVRDLIKAEKIKPSDLFGAETLAEDSSVKGLIDGETRRATSGEYAHRKRTEEAFTAARKEWEDKDKAKDNELKTLKQGVTKGQLPALLEKKKTERKFDDKQVKFIAARIDKFMPSEKAEELEKDFDRFLDGAVDEYKVLAKDVFGIVEEKKVEGAGGTGTESGGKVAPPTLNPYLDPAKNPFIKLD